MKRTCILFAVLAVFVVFSNAAAYPEFQKFSQANSGRPTNCAMCHSNSDGPEGAGRGQIGNLTPVELNRLNQARGAFAPGMLVDSPILNEFGNKIITTLGKTRFLELRSQPVALAPEYGMASDLDHDGIGDADEYLAGTHPLNSSHGDPWRLFLHNLAVNRFHVILLVLATAGGLYGLSHLLHGLAAKFEISEQISLNKTEKGE